MRTEILVALDNRPGRLAALGEVLGRAGVNIDAIAGFGINEAGIVRLVPSDPDRACAALELAGLAVAGSTEVFEVTLDDRPGALGAFSRQLSGAGVNVEAIYLAGSEGERTHLIVSVDDVDRAKQIL